MNIQSLWTPPAGERIVGLTQYRDNIYVATDRYVYRITEIDIDGDIRVEMITPYVPKDYDANP
jgi:hypothetical protein